MTLTEDRAAGVALDASELAAALTAAAEAAARHLPGPATVMPAQLVAAVGPESVPGPGSLAVTTGLTGAGSGRLVFALSASTALALEQSPLGAQDIAVALEGPVGDAIAALEPTFGGTLDADAPLLLEADMALTGPDLNGGSAVVVAIHCGGAHAATLALVAHGAEPLPAPAQAGPANGASAAAGTAPEFPDLSDLPSGISNGSGSQPPAAPPGAGGWTDAARQAAAFPGAGPDGMGGYGPDAVVEPRPLGLLHDVEMAVTAELGRTRMTVRELLSLTPGSVVELDRVAGSAVDLLVNGKLIARGEVVVVDDEFGVRISEIVSRDEAARRR